MVEVAKEWELEILEGVNLIGAYGMMTSFMILFILSLKREKTDPNLYCVMICAVGFGFIGAHAKESVDMIDGAFCILWSILIFNTLRDRFRAFGKWVKSH